MAVTVGPKLSGEQKAAILLISLGPEISSEVFKELKEEHVEQVALQIANMKKVTPAERDSVMEETYQLSMAEEYISAGGVVTSLETVTTTLAIISAEARWWIFSTNANSRL